jgi:phosphopantetheinyl transferase
LTTHPAVRTPPALPENEVHVWLAQPALSDHAQLEARYLSLLSADEREQHRKFHFCNLTHTAGLVGCVIARGRECGIDIETRRPLDDMDGVARLMFSTDERRHLASLTEPARQHHFFALWTLKEAYAKATGDGIGSELTQVSFAVDNDAVSCRIGTGATQGGWWFHSSSPSSEHALAVALRSPLNNTSVVVKEFQL